MYGCLTGSERARKEWSSGPLPTLALTQTVMPPDGQCVAMVRQAEIAEFSPPSPAPREERQDSATFAVAGGSVTHPLLREGAMEARAYQLRLSEIALAESTLVVLPTGLGKTVVAALVAAEVLRRDPACKVVVLAPTRPLVAQHASTMASVLRVEPGRVAALTGRERPEKRTAAFAGSRVIASTPQGFARDVEEGRIPLAGIGLMVFDEAHRAVGDYSYVPIAEAYREARPRGLVLGLTASPGASRERVEEVRANLGLARVEARSAAEPDVEPYVKGIDVECLPVELTKPMREAQRHLAGLARERCRKLAPFLPKGLPRESKKSLLIAGEAIRARMGKSRKKGFYFGALQNQGVALQAVHCLELLETQGAEPLRAYIERLERSDDAGRAQRGFLKAKEFQEARAAMANERGSHPKVPQLVRVLKEQFARKPDSLVLVFAQFRDTVRHLVEELGRNGLMAARFVGQADREGDEGLSQTQQAGILADFSARKLRVLVATSVAEEGIHVPSVDLVVFYEPVPSEIRTIQRRGRTGRTAVGRVVILYAKGTRDEAFLHAGRRKEEQMGRIVRGMGERGKTPRRAGSVTLSRKLSLPEG